MRLRLETSCGRATHLSFGQGFLSWGLICTWCWLWEHEISLVLLLLICTWFWLWEHGIKLVLLLIILLSNTSLDYIVESLGIRHGGMERMSLTPT